MDDASQTSGYTVPEICSHLNISPRTFRQLLTDFGQFIPLEEDSQGLKFVREETLERLRRITMLTNSGLSRDAIKDQLRGEGVAAPSRPAAAAGAPVPAWDDDEAAGDAGAAGDGGDAGDANGSLQADSAGDPLDSPDSLRTLISQLRDIELQRAEDRDKLMLSLMKIQKEIQHLRYELAAVQSRSQRKRRGLFARWFSQ